MSVTVAERSPEADLASDAVPLVRGAGRLALSAGWFQRAGLDGGGRRWFDRQLEAWERALSAVRLARSAADADVDGLLEDAELAGAELVRIVGVFAEPLDCRDEVVAAARAEVARRYASAVACGEGERPMPVDHAQPRAIGGGRSAGVSTGAWHGAHNEPREGSEA